jgi:hypothetical protein
MNNFSRRHHRSTHASSSTATARASAQRDVVWGRPLFRAPSLNPRVAFEPLPFTAARVTRRPATSRATPVNAPEPAS